MARGKARLSLDVPGSQELEASPLPFPSFPLTNGKEAEEGGPFLFQMWSQKSKNPEVGVM